jgi:hypothetical protein
MDFRPVFVGFLSKCTKKDIHPPYKSQGRTGTTQIDLPLPSTYLRVVTIYYPVSDVLALIVHVVYCTNAKNPRGYSFYQLKKPDKVKSG